MSQFQNPSWSKCTTIIQYPPIFFLNGDDKSSHKRKESMFKGPPRRISSFLCRPRHCRCAKEFVSLHFLVDSVSFFSQRSGRFILHYSSKQCYFGCNYAQTGPRQFDPKSFRGGRFCWRNVHVNCRPNTKSESCEAGSDKPNGSSSRGIRNEQSGDANVDSNR